MAKFFSVLFDAVGSFLLCVVLVVVFFNPVSFLIWSFVAPRRAAAIVSDTQDDGKFIQFMVKLHKQLTYLYPMRVKKYFMLALGMKNYSAKAQVKAFRALNESDAPAKAVKLIAQMSDVAVSNLWDDNMLRHRSYNPVITYAVTESGKTLMIRQLKELFAREDYDSFGNYAKNHTLSKAALELLIERMEQKSEDKESFDKLQDVLFSQIEKNGLPAKLVEKVMLLGIGNSAYLQKLDCAIETFRQKTVVLSGNKEAFEKLLESRSLFSSVEKLLKPWQYGLYKLANRHMTDEAICEFIARENTEMCSLIFAREQLSEKARLMAKANPKFVLMLNY